MFADRDVKLPTSLIPSKLQGKLVWVRKALQTIKS